MNPQPIFSHDSVYYKRWHAFIRHKLVHRTLVIINVEPSWIAEGISGVCLFLWATFMLLSDDFASWPLLAYCLPVLALVVGPARFAVFVWYAAFPRAVCALVGATLWYILASTVWAKTGFIGAGGVYLGIMIGDIVTLIKFSSLAYRFTAIEMGVK